MPPRLECLTLCGGPCPSLSPNVVVGDLYKPMNTESMKNLDFILMTGSIYQILFTNDYQLTTNYFVRNYQRKMQNKPNSPNVQMSLTIFITMNYTNFISLVRQKNKPNSNPIKAKSNPIAEVTKMSVNIYYTKVYNNEAALRWKKQSQFKPKQSMS